MLSRTIRLGLLAGLLSTSVVADSRAQSPAGPPVCQCAAYNGPHVHLGVPPSSTKAGANRSGDPAVSPNERGLPRGRRYYGGRYFGSFNNRYYGPQYGYF